MDSPDLDDPALMDKLDACVGYSVPAPFRGFVARLNEIARTVEPEANWEDELGFAWVMSGGIYQRRWRTPPEVFLFASMGVDGVEYGHVNRAPELASEDLPFVQVDPWERQVSLEGATAADTIRERLLQQAEFRDEDEPAVAARVRRVADLLGFGAAARSRASATEELAARLKGLDADAKADALMEMLDEADDDVLEFADAGIPVSIPRGYRHVPTLDAIGVLAPVDAFGGAWPSGRQVPDTQAADADRLLAEARSRSAHPAAALVAFKDWFSVPRSEENPHANREMADCYLRLGRPRLAAHALISADLDDEARAILSTDLRRR